MPWRTPGLVAQYQAFSACQPGFAAERVLELGLSKGSSMAFWAEALAPTRLVGVTTTPLAVRNQPSCPPLPTSPRILPEAQPPRKRAFSNIDIVLTGMVSSSSRMLSIRRAT